MQALPGVLLVLGMGIALARAIQISRMNVQNDALRAIMLKLIKSGDRERGKKLLRAVPETAIGAALTQVMMRADEFNERTAAATVRDGLEKKFDEAFAPEAARITAWRFVAVASLSLAASALLVSVQAGSLHWGVAVGAGITVVLVVLTARASHKILTGGPEVFRALLPALVSAISKPPDTYRVPSLPVELVLDPAPTAERPKAERPSAAARAGVLFIDVRRAGAPTHRLELEQSIVKIGTHEKSQVQLDPAGDVSRIHAVIEYDGQEAVIIDLGSSAGTWVRGEKVAKTVLRHGDEVRIGDSTLHIGLGAPAQSLEDLLLGPLGPMPISTALSTPPSSETDDPQTWRSAAAMHVYGFESRAPDLFYEIADSILRASEPSRGVRLAKIRRKEGSPKFLVVLLGGDATVRAARSVIEAQASGRYRQCAAPPAEIAPDAAYGAETSTHARLRDELGSGAVDILTTTKIAS